MKLFSIQEKYIAEDNNHVTCYRRLVTPLFTKNLRVYRFEWKALIPLYLYGVKCKPYTGWIRKECDDEILLWIDDESKEQARRCDIAVAQLNTNVYQFNRSA